MLIGELAHLLKAEDVGIGIPESLGQEGQSELEEVLERGLLGETPDVVGETRKGVWHLLSVVKGHVVVHLDRLIREIAVAAEIVFYIGVFLSPNVFGWLGKGSDAPCFALGAATRLFDTETTGYRCGGA